MMKRVASVMLVLLALMSLAIAGELTAVAISSDDNEDSFDHASTGIRGKLGTPEAFMLMVGGCLLNPHGAKAT